MPLYALMGFLVLAGPLAALLRPVEAGSDLRLLIVAPWQDGAQIVQAAGGQVVGPLSTSFALLVQVSEASNFDQIARAAGTLWIADGKPLAQLCGVG